LPANWPGFTATVKINGDVHEIEVSRDDQSAYVVRIDGELQKD
jgi:cellobiose phosphorylase